MFEGIKKRVHTYILNKELMHHKPERSVTNIADAKEVGVLLDASDTDKTAVVLQFADSIRTQYRKVTMLGYYNFPKAAMNLSFPHFYNKNLNWYLQPQGYMVDDFIEKKFDVLVNAYTDENLPLEYISALSNAKYRIGLYNPAKTYLSDVLIDLKGDHNLGALTEQLKNYIFVLK
jgi:hypothetical protein